MYMNSISTTSEKLIFFSKCIYFQHIVFTLSQFHVAV